MKNERNDLTETCGDARPTFDPIGPDNEKALFGNFPRFGGFGGKEFLWLFNRLNEGKLHFE